MYGAVLSGRLGGVYMVFLFDIDGLDDRDEFVRLTVIDALKRLEALPGETAREMTGKMIKDEIDYDIYH